MNHPLASLVGPLRYACQRDFARLDTVKGLRPVLEHALAGAGGVDARVLEHLRAALPDVDDPAPERRKAALRRVVAGLRLSGVPLPVELEGVATGDGRRDGGRGPGAEAARAGGPTDSRPPGAGLLPGLEVASTRAARRPGVAVPPGAGAAASHAGEGRTLLREGALSPGAKPRATPPQGIPLSLLEVDAPGATPPGYVPPWKSTDPLPGGASSGGGAPARAKPGASATGGASSSSRGVTSGAGATSSLHAQQGTRAPSAARAGAMTSEAGSTSSPRGAASATRAGVMAPGPGSAQSSRAGAPAQAVGRMAKGPRQGVLDTGPEAVPGARTRKEKAERKQKRAAAAEASRNEAKLLSIAPRTGPLSMPLKTLDKRLGPKLVSTLNKKGLRRMGDILFLLPRCYEDRRQLRTIAELEPGARGVTVGTVKAADFVAGRGGRRMFRAVVGDRSGSIAATYFHAGPWLKSRFTVGKRIVLSGEVRATMSGREMAHPEIEPAEDLDSITSVHFNRIVPVYPGFERGEQRSFRELTSNVGDKYADALEDPLPVDLRRRLALMGLPEALRFIHFPPGDADLDALDSHLSPAHRRLAFDELFFLQLGMALKRQDVKAEVGISFDVSAPRLEKARSALPFKLTDAQARVVEELCRDLARPEPMSRLVQGDVGSGKTAVAMVAALVALQDGYQVAVMAPTEILAEQHERTFRKVLEPLGYRVGLVSSAGTAKSKRDRRDAVARGDVHLAVGTHALIQDDVAFRRLGLVVIDEQHRFGVLQRHSLMSKGPKPDVLVMTATPIPRTLAMTMYGDLDLSVIDQLPPGRTPISTRVFNEKQRARVYESVASELAKGHQAYVVYPLVEESEKLDLEDATQGVEKLRVVFPQARVGLLHGRMKGEEKDSVMEDFREKRLDLLVCTTVVEVGVDVPNASVMVVESAERFGLSQLHQLRGRVGRGAAASYCFLVAGAARSWESTERLSVMEHSSDGFVIAEKDLEIRGPGEFLGTRQSGLPELAVANLARDGDLLSMAQSEARRILEKDPDLKAREHQGLVKALEERWEGRLALARVG
ncbi:ATP-dependent DNA helicase RecG [Pyxidicoccus xibeiensis]|uniref:ATP-dependent DNA helicase RecG n=1 Tax=Pyxidicoccus xibeiensis TaxID=2906759 RepID=UPI0020A7B666|nr:ATP-dependent DNA helicase RecG [Pyxidicoccus xibeiensis]MCP3144512.1 ATP-dependent DNA helicase RecG [Pyxidicoccus xibeiensis]